MKVSATSFLTKARFTLKLINELLTQLNRSFLQIANRLLRAFNALAGAQYLSVRSVLDNPLFQ